MYNTYVKRMIMGFFNKANRTKELEEELLTAKNKIKSFLNS